MSFVEDLREARTARITIRHEFLTKYDPAQMQAHAFVEGYEDLAFYREMIARVSRCVRQSIFVYYCGGKRRVYEELASLLRMTPIPDRVLFCVDKDLSDFVAEIWRHDDRVFVTNTYSIENYFVVSDVIRTMFSELIQCRGFSLDCEPIIAKFEIELRRFYSTIRTTMAWAIAARRLGFRPVLQNVHIREICAISDDCSVTVLRGRSARLARIAGLSATKISWFAVLSVRENCASVPRRVTCAASLNCSL